MKYILDNTITFRTDDYLFLNESNGEVVATLTLTMGRLLTYLIENHGDVCTREDILENVWEAYGLHSSNNSLNKYVSDIRKIFNSLELNEKYIITVPRIGFMLSAELNVSTIEVKEKTPVLSLKNNHHYRRSNRRYFFSATIIFLLALFSSPIFSDFFEGNKGLKINDYKKSRTYSIGVVKGCDVKLIDDKQLSIISLKKKIAEELIAKNKIKCDTTSNVLLKISDRVIFGQVGRVFIAHCHLKHGNVLTLCASFYEADYVINS